MERAEQLKLCYYQTWLLEDLDERVRAIRNALELLWEEPGTASSEAECTSGLHPGAVVSGWVELSFALRDRYEHIAETADLEERIRTLRRILRALPGDPMTTTLAQRELGEALRARFKLTGDSQDILDAFEIHSSLLNRHSLGHPDYHRFLYEKGATQSTRSERFADDEGLVHSIALLREAIRLCPESDPRRHFPQLFLASALWVRHNQHGDMSDLHTAIAMCRDILHHQPSNHRDRTLACSRLGVYTMTLYTQTNDINHATESLEWNRQALDLKDTRCPILSRLPWAVNLACSLDLRYDRLGNVGDLHEAIGLLRPVVDIPHATDNGMRILAQLAAFLHRRYKVLGTDDDLDESIGLCREALGFFPHDHPWRNQARQELRTMLQDRYRRLGGRWEPDLLEAISLLREGIALCAEGRYDHTETVFDLVGALCLYHEDFRRPKCLEEAVTLCETWFKRRQDTEQYLRGLFLHKSARVAMLRYYHHRQQVDLDTTVSRYEEALKARPVGHISRHESLIELADALCHRFEVVRATEDATKAMTLLKDALEGLSVGHPDRATPLFQMARLHLLEGTPSHDIPTALDILAQALSDRHQSAQARLRSALMILKTLEHDVSISLLDPQSRMMLLDVYIATAGLLPRVAYFGLDIDSRLRVLADADKLAVDGAAHALILEQPQLAIELLEQGRAVFWSQQLRLRTAFDALPLELSIKLTRTAFLLENGCQLSVEEEEQVFGDGNQAKAAQEKKAADRRRLGGDFEALIHQVRAMPGFERFMLPEPFQALRAVASRGPVVILIANQVTVQAIVAEQKGIQQVQLPEANVKDLRALSHMMVEAVRRGRGHMRDRAIKRLDKKLDHTLERVLQELWRVVIGRIIEAIQLEVPPNLFIKPLYRLICVA